MRPSDAPDVAAAGGRGDDIDAWRAGRSALLATRLRDAGRRGPVRLDAGLDLASACRELARRPASEALVDDGTRTGLFGAAELRDAWLRAEPPGRLTLRDSARFDAPGADGDCTLQEALALLRGLPPGQALLIRDGDCVAGLFGAADAVALLEHDPQAVSPAIAAARTVDELRPAAARIETTLAALHDAGLAVDAIARLAGRLNRQFYARLWTLLAPPRLLAGSCLLVMGSEGRNEQIVRTDQDNALLLRDGTDAAGLAEAEAAARRFNDALAGFGWPPCPGGVMLTNPLWRRTLAEFRESLADWVHGHEADGVLRLAIFVDAAAVAGDAALLHGARRQLDRLMVDNDAFFARFAAAADRFPDPGSWWRRLTGQADEQPLDLKKIGIFPIVHGVRALALQQGLHATATAERVRLLAAARRLDADLARDLLDALRALMALRLDRQLRRRRDGAPSDNLLLPSALATLERNQLHGAVAIVRRFRQFLRLHFRLDSL